jgi:hypothetical protein
MQADTRPQRNWPQGCRIKPVSSVVRCHIALTPALRATPLPCNGRGVNPVACRFHPLACSAGEGAGGPVPEWGRMSPERGEGLKIADEPRIYFDAIALQLALD